MGKSVIFETNLFSIVFKKVELLIVFINSYWKFKGVWHSIFPGIWRNDKLSIKTNLYSSSRNQGIFEATFERWSFLCSHSKSNQSKKYFKPNNNSSFFLFVCLLKNADFVTTNFKGKILAIHEFPWYACRRIGLFLKMRVKHQWNFLEFNGQKLLLHQWKRILLQRKFFFLNQN